MIDLEDKIPGLAAKIKDAEGLPIRFHDRLWQDLELYFVGRPVEHEEFNPDETDDRVYNGLSLNDGVEKLLNAVIGGDLIFLPLNSEPIRIEAKKEVDHWSIA